MTFIIALISILAVIWLCETYARRQRRRLWLTQRQWDREDREARREQDRLDMEEGLRLLHTPMSAAERRPS